MADQNQNSDQERTEEPSAQRLEEFRQEGDVSQSRELTSVFVLFSCLIAFYLSGSGIRENFFAIMRELFATSGTTTLTQATAGNVLLMVLKALAQMILPIAGAGFAAGVIGSVIQVGINFTLKPLEPKFEKINPVQGFFRILSLNSLVEGLKSIVKLATVIFVTYLMIKKEIIASPAVIEMETNQLAAYLGTIGMKFIGVMCMALFVIAAMDFGYQKFRYHQRLMMTKQEFKEEQKQREGDPNIKARMRSIQRELSRRRMMQEVPKADVVITNPTHIAVALKYDSTEMRAPKVVAKGTDLIAQKIKEIAKKSGVPLVENVPLARALHKNVKVGKAIPRALYQAVAEVLAYVYRLKGKFKV